MEKIGSYSSAADLPSFRELATQLRAMKLFTVFSPKLRADMRDIERQMREIVQIVDDFYEKLGRRHWIFHGQLQTEKVAAVIGLPEAEAERAFIEIYMSPEWLPFWVVQISNSATMRPWSSMLHRALNDYNEGRFYATTLGLIAVMDGFVNIVDRSRQRGLHARSEADMQAWDSVIGHHLGLTNIMPVFTRSINKVIDEPVYEVHRHGIVHGMVVNFDNAVVATKAWNYLFAVVDWAEDKKRQAAPKETPTLREIGGALKQNSADKKALQAWAPGPSSPDQRDWERSQPVQAIMAYLDAWHSKNYGRVATFLQASARDRLGKLAPGEMRKRYRGSELGDYELLRLEHAAPAIVVAHYRLTIRGEVHQLGDRWLYQGLDGRSMVAGKEGGAWVRVFDSCPL